LGFVHGSFWLWFTSAIALISIFLYDINIIFLSSDSDVWVTIAYIVFICIFGIELIILSAFQESYFGCGNQFKACGCSLFFWADLLSFLSLIPDCIPFNVITDSIPENASNYPFIIMSSIRILRLFRLWRIFKLMGFFNIYSTKISSFAHRLAKTYVTYAGMKNGCLLLILCFALSLLSFDVKYVGPPMSAEIIEGLIPGSPMFESILERFVTSYPIILFTLDGVVIYDAQEDIDDYRDLELEYFTTDRSEIIMDVTELTKGESIYFIIKYIILIIVFLIAVYLLDRDINNRFTKIFKEVITRTVKVAKILGVYSSNDYLYLNPLIFYDEMLEEMYQATASRKKVEE